MSPRKRAGMTWDDVVRIGLELPEVEVGTAYGTPALRVRGSFMCRVRELVEDAWVEKAPKRLVKEHLAARGETA